MQTHYPFFASSFRASVIILIQNETQLGHIIIFIQVTECDGTLIHVSLLQEISHFLSVTSCDSLPLTRLEGLKELTRQLHDNKGQIRELLKECHGIMLKEEKWSLHESDGK